MDGLNLTSQRCNNLLPPGSAIHRVTLWPDVAAGGPRRPRVTRPALLRDSLGASLLMHQYGEGGQPQPHDVKQSKSVVDAGAVEGPA